MVDAGRHEGSYAEVDEAMGRSHVRLPPYVIRHDGAESVESLGSGYECFRRGFLVRQYAEIWLHIGFLARPYISYTNGLSLSAGCPIFKMSACCLHHEKGEMVTTRSRYQIHRENCSGKPAARDWRKPPKRKRNVITAKSSLLPVYLSLLADNNVFLFPRIDPQPQQVRSAIMAYAIYKPLVAEDLVLIEVCVDDGFFGLIHILGKLSAVGSKDRAASAPRPSKERRRACTEKFDRF